MKMQASLSFKPMGTLNYLLILLTGAAIGDTVE